MTEMTSTELSPFPENQNIQVTTEISNHPLSPKGRFGRLSYLAWMFIIGMIYTCVLGIAVVLGLLAVYMSPERSLSVLFSSAMGISAVVLAVFSVIATMVASICITIRRLHDLDKSGWLCLIFFIPLIGAIFGLYIMAAKGTDGENKFGVKRPTEQTEKVIGSLNLVLIVLYLLVMIPAMISYQQIISQMSQMQTEEQMMMSEGEPEMTDEQLAAYLEQIGSEEDSELAEDTELAVVESSAEEDEAAIAAAEASIEN